MPLPTTAGLGSTAAIRAYLRERWPACADEIAEATGLPRSNVGNRLIHLAQSGELIREDRERWKAGHRTTPYFRPAGTEGPGLAGPEARERARRAALEALAAVRSGAAVPRPGGRPGRKPYAATEPASPSWLDEACREITAADIRPSNQVAGIDHVDAEDDDPGPSKPADRQNRSRS